MGFALARAAVHLGCSATLIAGPVDLDTPSGVTRIDVTSATEMQRAALRHSKGSDIIIMAAAVADFRPFKISKAKIKKTSRNAKGLSLKLKRNPDILAELSKSKRKDQIIVGFALETAALEKNARKKMKDKCCDFIIANSAKSIGADVSSATLFGRGKKVRLPRLPKEDLAIIILSHILG